MTRPKTTPPPPSPSPPAAFADVQRGDRLRLMRNNLFAGLVTVEGVHNGVISASTSVYTLHFRESDGVQCGDKTGRLQRLR